MNRLSRKEFIVSVIIVIVMAVAWFLALKFDGRLR